MSECLDRVGRLRGAVYGLLIGDALGVPYEFSDAHALPPAHLVEMRPPATFRRAHADVPPGTWSDDGAHALHLLNVFLDDGDHDLESRLARGLLSWQLGGTMTPDGVVFDVGAQTQQALGRLHRGVAATESGLSDERSNGNGSLMRALPAALVPAESDQAYVTRARRQSIPTHAHARAQLACALSVLTGVRLMEGKGFRVALNQALDSLSKATPRSDREELSLLRNFDLGAIAGTGYVVDSFWSAAAAVANTKDFEGCVHAAIAYGGDTDTTACIAGGWAGLLYGESGIPPRWREQLLGSDVVEPLLARLCAPARAEHGLAVEPQARPARGRFRSWLVGMRGSW
jgi:ADP-ribosyl-[dinitrogen reductase] hydrolase